MDFKEPEGSFFIQQMGIQAVSQQMPVSRTDRYFSQLKMYALALERITGMPVKEIRLCLLLSGEHISVDAH